MKRIKSGVYGLDTLMGGGINIYSSTVVIGPTGAGKTTIATQFIRRGLEDGKEGIFISMDENKDQIIREAKEMGWTDIDTYIKNSKLVFVDASGKKFKKFLETQLPDFVDTWEGVDTRIVIDPLTPIIWATPNRYDQRETIATLFRLLRRIGTIFATLEEHSPTANLTGNEVVIPMYLADNVIYLNYCPLSENENIRTIRVIKARNTRHDTRAYVYRIIKGMGLVVDIKHINKKRYLHKREEYLAAVKASIKEMESKGKKISPKIKRKILDIASKMDIDDMDDMPPKYLIDVVLESY